MTKSTNDKEILLTEYEASQSSAQFHSGLIWTVSNFLWATALVLYGFILTQIKCAELKILLTCLSLLGIMMVVFSWIFALQFNSITNQKYKRCKEIEEILGMSQHTSLKYQNYSQRFLYWLIIKFFIVCWIILLVYIWKT